MDFGVVSIIFNVIVSNCGNSAHLYCHNIPVHVFSHGIYSCALFTFVKLCNY